jgi:TPR repeat protein
MTANGQGFDPDPASAVPWFEKAADQGMVEAQVALADMLLAGRGTARDEQAARHWYEQAARQGNETAARRLERMG